MNPDETSRITYYWRDDDGAVSSHQVRATRNLAVSSAFARNLAPLLRAVSNCTLERLRVALRYLDDTNPSAQPNSTVYRCSIMIFTTATGDHYVLSLPGVSSALLIQPPDSYAGIMLDLNHVAVAAFVSGILTGVGTTQPCSPSGEDLVDIEVAYWGYERAGW